MSGRQEIAGARWIVVGLSLVGWVGCLVTEPLGALSESSTSELPADASTESVGNTVDRASPAPTSDGPAVAPSDAAPPMDAPATDAVPASGDAHDASADADANEGAAPVPSDPTGLVAYYPFDELTGATANDASGNGESATLVNGASFGPALRGNGVALAGTTQYVALPEGIVRGLLDFSVSAWVNMHVAAPGSRIFDFGDGTGTYMTLSGYSHLPGGLHTLHFGIAADGMGEEVLDSTPLPSGTWSHVAVTMTGGTVTLYVNGAQVAQSSGFALTPASLGATTQNWIGRSQYSTDPYFDGQIDELRIYARALTGAEVLAQAKLLPLAWYKFDEGAGAIAKDSSGHANVATLAGGAGWGMGRNGPALDLGGNGGYVALPGALLAGASSATVATWINLGAATAWERVFDFGSGTGTYMMLTPSNAGGFLNFSITTTSWGGEQRVMAPPVGTASWVHLAITLGGGNGTLYVNGNAAGPPAAIGLTPAALGATPSDWIGRSQYAGDPSLDARMNDFCVYDRALSAAEVAILAR